jgi:hypothetical protein
MTRDELITLAAAVIYAGGKTSTEGAVSHAYYILNDAREREHEFVRTCCTFDPRKGTVRGQKRTVLTKR